MRRKTIKQLNLFSTNQLANQVKILKQWQKTFKVISLFSGCGGMDLGFVGGFEFLRHYYEKLPFETILANDVNSSACATYRHNLKHDIICADIWDVINELPRTADVVIGGFPCQDISINGKRRGIAGKRSGLYRAMVVAVDKIRPKVFVAENVKGLLMKGAYDSLMRVLSDFRELGYSVSYQLYNAAAFGVPQTRDRVFIVGVQPDLVFTHPQPVLNKDEYITAYTALSDLEALPETPEINHIWSKANRSKEQGNRCLKADRPGYTIRAECHGNIQFHYQQNRRISMREAARIQSFPDNFIFQAKLRETERQIGNAVPPVLAWFVARAVAEALDSPPASV